MPVLLGVSWEQLDRLDNGLTVEQLSTIHAELNLEQFFDEPIVVDDIAITLVVNEYGIGYEITEQTNDGVNIFDSDCTEYLKFGLINLFESIGLTIDSPDIGYHFVPEYIEQVM